MANTIGKIIKTGKNIFDHLDSKVNFTIPENLVSYLGINGRQNDKNLKLNENNFRLQIGKMQKDKETIYTKELLLPAIEYIIKKTGDGEKSVIQLRPDLAKYLTNEDQKEESKQILSFEEEKQKIIQLIKKYFKNKTKSIEIVNISNQYPDVFSILKEKGKDGLISTEKPILSKDNFSALNISKYLYGLSQKNPKLMELFYNTKTPAQKENDTKPIGENQSDYYSLVEVSIRLYEVLSGISIQGGIDRQIKYDKIIGGILQRKDIEPFKIKDYPELEELHNLCLETNPDFVFDRLRIGTKDAEKTGKEFQEKTQKLSKFKARSLITSVALMSVLAGLAGGYAISDYIQKKKIKSIAQDKIKEYDIDLKIDGSKVWNITSLDEKERYLNNVADAFIGAYGTGKIDKEDIFYMVVDCFGPNSFHYDNYGKDKFKKLNFINNELITQNKVKLKNNGIDLEPYKELSEYEDAFINSRSDTTGIEVEKSFTDFMLSGSGISESEVNKIGSYVTIYGSQYDLGYITRDRQFGKLNNFDSDFAMGKYKRYLVAKSKDSELRGFSDSFSVKNAKYLCEDYFLRTRPQIQSACDIIKIACRSKKGYFTDEQVDQIQTITTQYFIKNKISRDKLSKYQEGRYLTDLLDFVYYKILKDSSTEFKKIGIDPVPYDIFNEFIDAFQNTQAYRELGNDLRGNDDFLVPSSDELSKYNEKYIGDYIDQEGNSFGVFYITVEGKRYIIANERKNTGYNNDACILYGTQIREDFQKNRLNKY